MPASLNETHDPKRRSFVEGANAPGCDFPIQNLPFCAFRPPQISQSRVGVAIGDQIVDIAAAANSFDGLAAEAARACATPFLNSLMSMGPQAWSALRLGLSRGLAAENGVNSRLRPYLVPMNQAEIWMPVAFRNFTDFFASIFHASNAGRMFRPDNPLMPNYKYVPVAYHSRASSVRVSGAPVKRPNGQRKGPNEAAPSFGPSRHLDFELELGAFVGTGSELGQSVAVGKAAEHIFGYCLLNDWSARDIQAWEYQPLGPFLGKNFATTISPWVVTLEALAPFRAPWLRPAAEPAPLAYLDDPHTRAAGALDIRLEAWLQSARMRAAGSPPQRLSHATFRDAWWTVAHMLAHHTVNGCNLRPGDLFGSGTQSGPQADEAGSLLELSSGGRQPVALAGGEARTFLEDGDRVILRGWCERAGFARIGFGEAAGTVLPALAP
jgi:fumarylacetoacetase